MQCARRTAPSAHPSSAVPVHHLGEYRDAPAPAAIGFRFAGHFSGSFVHWEALRHVQTNTRTVSSHPTAPCGKVGLNPRASARSGGSTDVPGRADRLFGWGSGGTGIDATAPCALSGLRSRWTAAALGGPACPARHPAKQGYARQIKEEPRGRMAPGFSFEFRSDGFQETQISTSPRT